ncbi:uncharacterized protein C8Q71DRAFT_715091 [Rhodofomes roseus]|uniref:Arrestin-like N-terminal domain-containing protein n=1 Tax=Rhodofomes roseus TaxID=34475 RepID=A0ABQ8K425_9APHY|nr:uncharacterized protein C8Q71DRAFT_715091 [Rhodofomes roseus]KAH9831610.1 hypothetical protein C8Q71DRAFT_715091 [Rhodofomes roseus]
MAIDRDASQCPPEYTDTGGERAEPVKYTAQLENGTGKAWLWLTVESRAKSPKQRPLFANADTVRGTVEIDYGQAGKPKELSITVRASLTAVGQEEERLLCISKTLWSGKDPSAPKLAAGRSNWPFSITLPDEIPLPSSGRSKASSPTCPLPPSFSEKGGPAYIEYQLVATVRRGLFKSNQTLVCPLVYLPVTRAEPPARLRMAAYRDGTALVGPDGDPEGWKVGPSAKVTGTLFDARQVDVEYTLAVARPLSCARGSPIPLSLTVASDDEQALDLLSTPASMNLYLVRSRVLGQHAMSEDAGARSDQVFQERVGTAYFWPSDAGSPSGGKRALWGELLVKPDSKPSFVCPGFSLRYALALLPPEAAGFVPKIHTNEPLVAQKIAVTTAGAPGVSVPSHAPPGYTYPEEADYTNALGYLENGNQRRV